MVHQTFVYYLDMFKVVDMDTNTLLELVEKNPLEIFNSIKEILDDLGEIKDVQVHNVFFNSKTFEAVIEYIVCCNIGEVSVKVIYSNNPVKALRRYYEYERSKNEKMIDI